MYVDLDHLEGWTAEPELDSGFLPLAFSPDGGQLLGCIGAQLYELDLAKRRATCRGTYATDEMVEYDLLDIAPRSAHYAADGRIVVFADVDLADAMPGYVVVLDRAPGRRPTILHDPLAGPMSGGDVHGVPCIALSADGVRLALAAGARGEVWRLGPVLEVVRTFVLAQSPLAMAWDPAGRLLAVRDACGIEVRDGATGDVVRRVTLDPPYEPDVVRRALLGWSADAATIIAVERLRGQSQVAAVGWNGVELVVVRSARRPGLMPVAVVDGDVWWMRGDAGVVPRGVDGLRLRRERLRVGRPRKVPLGPRAERTLRAVAIGENAAGQGFDPVFTVVAAEGDRVARVRGRRLVVTALPRVPRSGPQVTA